MTNGRVATRIKYDERFGSSSGKGKTMSNNNEQGFRGVPGIPDGWELVRIVDRPQIGEYALVSANRPVMVTEPDSWDLAVIVRRIEKPKEYRRKIEKQKQYRQFENGEEFKPFRDRWWRYKSEKFTSRPPRGYDDCGWICGDTWGRLFDAIVFDDGTPFGVEVTE
jgi:hypothetical protein